MKMVLAALVVGVLAAVAWSPAAEAQAPQGSYLRSCRNVAVSGDVLGALCRREGGREQRSNLAGFRRCVGDIGNDNGILQCAVPGGGVARGQVVPEPGFGGPPPGQPPAGGPPGYGPPGYGPPGYAPPPPGPGGNRCGELRREADDLRERIRREPNPYERARLEDRLRDVRRDMDRRC